MNRISDYLNRILEQERRLRELLLAQDRFGLSALKAAEISSSENKILAISKVSDISQTSTLRIEPYLTAEQRIQEIINLHDRNSTSQINHVHKTAGIFELSRLPYLSEIDNLARTFDSKLSQENFIQSMAQMRQPWLSQSDPGMSIRGLAEMQILGSAIHSYSAYDSAISKVFRESLGNWRGIDIPQAERFVDSGFQSDFYLKNGLDLSIAAFPAPAFEEGMEAAGFVPLTESDLDQPVEELEVLFRRNNLAQDRLQRIEYFVRIFINDILSKCAGEKWLTQRVPGDMRRRWEQRRDEDERRDGKTRDKLIDYADFSDLWGIMERKDNWPHFSTFFPDKDDARISFKRIHIIRIRIAHTVLINNIDAATLHLEGSQIIRAIKPEEAGGNFWLKP